MIEINRIDLNWWRSYNTDYRDDGYIKPGGKTRQFSVFARKSRSLLGYVKWWGKHRSYSFFPLNSVFQAEQMVEIAQFCEEATAVHKDRIPENIKLKRKQILERRKRRREKLAKKRLTNQQSSDKVDVKIAESQNLLVEGGGLAPNVVNGE